jgi:prepilin-type N-terminal cleavage/methylation domain-containing protein
MRPTSNRPGPRSGFTLVELLVVMTIIAILTSLTAAAVVKAIAKADEAKTRNDISQLGVGIQAFKSDFGVAYIPDTLYLPPGADPTGASTQYITSVWPRISPQALPSNPTTCAYWGTGSTFVKLQGYQTLVFFLGGAGGTALSPVGFSTNPTDPMNTTGLMGAANRKGPYFDFPPNRLVHLPSDQKNNNPFPAFIDVYGTMPYVYFSASKAGNDYNVTYNSSTAGPQTGQPLAGGPTFSILPFQISSTRFANANGYQIIAAGRDTLFHDPGNTAGGQLWPGYSGGGTDMGGYDNMSNFHPTFLGIPAN